MGYKNRVLSCELFDSLLATREIKGEIMDITTMWIIIGIGGLLGIPIGIGLGLGLFATAMRSEEE